MSELNIFKKQAKRFFQDIDGVDLLNSYSSRYEREKTIARSLGYKNFEDCIFDIYNTEGLLNYYNLQFEYEYDFLSNEEPSFYELDITESENIHIRNPYFRTSILMEDEKNLLSSKHQHSEKSLIIRELSQYPSFTPNAKETISINILKDVDSPKIDPINIAIKQLNYCLKFFSPQTSLWIHELVHKLCPGNNFIDISSFKHLFNIKYLLKVKEQSPLLQKYLNNLGITEQNITQEQIAQHKTLCANAMRISHVIESFPNCFESIKKAPNNEHYLLHRQENEQLTTIVNIDSTVDELHLLAGDLAMTAFLEISTNNKSEGITLNTTFSSNFAEIHILGLMKHHTFISYINKLKAHYFYIYCQADNLETLKQWQKEILFDGIHVKISNYTHNLTPHIHLKLKKYLFKKYKLSDEIRKEFKGSFQFYTTEQFITFNSENKKKKLY